MDFPKIQKQPKNTAFNELFRKVRVNFSVRPCDMRQSLGHAMLELRNPSLSVWSFLILCYDIWTRGRLDIVRLTFPGVRMYYLLMMMMMMMMYINTSKKIFACIPMPVYAAEMGYFQHKIAVQSYKYCTDSCTRLLMQMSMSHHTVCLRQ